MKMEEKNYEKLWKDLRQILKNAVEDSKSEEVKYILEGVLKIMDGLEGLEKGD